MEGVPRWALGLWVVLGACTAEPSTLVVDLRTDLDPSTEFDSVEVTLTPMLARLDSEGGPTMTFPRLGADEILAPLEGTRITEANGLQRGDWLVEVRLWLGDEVSGRGVVLAQLTELRQAVTVLVTRECQGVVCPGDGSQSDIACLEGQCVDPRCSPETPDFCPASECEVDEECDVNGPDAPLCARSVCLAGVCAAVLDDAGCPRGECTSAGCSISSVVSLGVGGSHACATLTTGGTRCWGANARGQLGVGGGGGAPRAVEVSGDFTRVVGAAAGAEHSCVRDRSGSVDCWGHNGSGQLGDGTDVERPSPVGVLDLAGASDVAAGADHSCAVVDGEAFCWGANDEGQLGDGTTTPSTSPVRVALTGVVVQVAPSEQHTCARLDDRRVFCWGLGTRGQLGDGRGLSSLVPVEVALADAVHVGAGEDYTCAVLGNGEVRCWGANPNGQHGDGTTEPHDLPVAAVGVTDAVQVSGGTGHTCARRASGEVLCWGRNTRGQLGDGTLIDRAIAAPVSGLGAAASVELGQDFSCARVTGEVWCWGAGDGGQLGDGGGVDRLIPVRVEGL